MTSHEHAPACADAPHLNALGWNEQIEHELAPALRRGLIPGRVVEAHPGLATVDTGTEAIRARCGLPVVAGDWVAVSVTGDPPEVIEQASRGATLERQSASGTSRVQTLAANVDLLLATVPLDVPVNVRRLERSLVLAYNAGLEPVVLLTKADVAGDLAGSIAAARSVCGEAPVVPVSALDDGGAEVARAMLPARRTAVLFGPSGSGKSTLTNALTGAEQTVYDVRADGKGRHTTTAARLLRVPGGGLLIDTPGVRGVGLVAARSDDGISLAFPDVEQLIDQCRFADCSHDREPGCAVQSAIATAKLDERRLDAWNKLRREERRAAARADERLARELRAESLRKYKGYARARRRGDYGPSR